MNEKTKLLMHRLIWLFVFLIILLVPIISNASKPKLELIDENVYIEEYYSGLNQTSIKIDLTFNVNVYSGYATIDFYDSSNNFLERKNIYLYTDGNVAENIYTTISGKVDKYQLVNYDFSPTSSDALETIFIAFLFPALLMFISALLLNYKEYVFEDKTISVYAGFFHNTLRINGEKYDEHSTFTSWTPIKLSTTLNEKTKIEATITLANRITLKIDDKLVNSKK